MFIPDQNVEIFLPTGLKIYWQSIEKKIESEQLLYLRPMKNVYIFSNFKKTLIKHSIWPGRILSPFPLKI